MLLVWFQSVHCFWLRLQPQRVFRVWFFSPLDHSCHCQSRVSPWDLSHFELGRKEKSVSLTRRCIIYICRWGALPTDKDLQDPCWGRSFPKLCLSCFYQLWWTHTCSVEIRANGSHRSYTSCTPHSPTQQSHNLCLQRIIGSEFSTWWRNKKDASVVWHGSGEEE